MTKRLTKAQRCSDILNSAIDIFLKKGFDNASMDEIASAAGISKGGLYHYYKSKDEILLEAVEVLGAPLDERLKELMNCEDIPAGLLMYAKDFFDIWVSHPRDTTFYYLALSKAAETPDYWPYFVEQDYESYCIFAALFRKGVETGYFIEHDCAAYGAMFSSAIGGICTTILMDKQMSTESVIEYLNTCFIKPLLKKTP